MLWNIYPDGEMWDWNLKKYRKPTWRDVDLVQIRGSDSGPNLGISLRPGRPDINLGPRLALQCDFVKTSKNWHETIPADADIYTLWDEIRKGGSPLVLLEYLISNGLTENAERIREAVKSSFDEWRRLQPYKGNLNAYRHTQT
jgi:hypothetical protein